MSRSIGPPPRRPWIRELPHPFVTSSDKILCTACDRTIWLFHDLLILFSYSSTAVRRLTSIVILLFSVPAKFFLQRHLRQPKRTASASGDTSALEHGSNLGRHTRGSYHCDSSPFFFRAEMWCTPKYYLYIWTVYFMKQSLSVRGEYFDVLSLLFSSQERSIIIFNFNVFWNFFRKPRMMWESTQRQTTVLLLFFFGIFVREPKRCLNPHNGRQGCKIWYHTTTAVPQHPKKSTKKIEREGFDRYFHLPILSQSTQEGFKIAKRVVPRTPVKT